MAVVRAWKHAGVVPMCTSIAFCGPCEDAAVRSWAEGKKHLLPEFGDGAQEFVARQLRRGSFRALLLGQAGVGSVREWPEYIKFLDEVAESGLRGLWEEPAARALVILLVAFKVKDTSRVGEFLAEPRTWRRKKLLARMSPRVRRAAESVHESMKQARVVVQTPKISRKLVAA